MPAKADEFIEHFNSDIMVNKNGSLSITETIVVHHEGHQIKRGIYRDLATTKGEHYEILGVTLNDEPEPWFAEKKTGCIRLNTGNDSFLPAPDTSTFKLSYIMYDALRPVKDRDLNELYLNITGRWNFPIKEVTAHVYYPTGTKVISQYGYQTALPAQQFRPDDNFYFKDLAPHDEVTIAQNFTKGTVDIPLPKNFQLIILGFALMITYYLIAWALWGKDPSPRPIVPDWQVPENLTPLECAYINNNGEPPANSFFLHIIWLLHKKVIKVMETDAPAFLGKKKFLTLTTQPDIDKTDREVKRYCQNYPNVLTLRGEASPSLGLYAKSLNESITARLESKYYYKRSFITFIGALFLPCVWFYIDPDSAITGLWIGFYTASFILPLLKTRNIFAILIAVLVAVPICFLIAMTDINLLIMYGIYIALILIFKHLMFQPTLIGQRTKERIDGLKMFLRTITANNIQATATSKDGLSMEKRLTPADMEALFPYAVALGLENKWADKFAALFGSEALQTLDKMPQYNTNFRTTLNTSCQKSAFVPPKSSGSGGFGGGHVGGGFGGGGGGGR